MSSSDLVRVRVGGQETNLSRAWAEKRGLEILEDEPTHRGDGSVRRPTRKDGRPMKPRRNLPPAVPATSDQDGDENAPADAPKPYAEQTDEELVALVEARNDARGDEEPLVVVAKPGERDQLIEALEEDDELQTLLASDGQ